MIVHGAGGVGPLVTSGAGKRRNEECREAANRRGRPLGRHVAHRMGRAFLVSARLWVAVVVGVMLGAASTVEVGHVGCTANANG